MKERFYTERTMCASMIFPFNATAATLTGRRGKNREEKFLAIPFGALASFSFSPAFSRSITRSLNGCSCSFIRFPFFRSSPEAEFTWNGPKRKREPRGVCTMAPTDGLRGGWRRGAPGSMADEVLFANRRLKSMPRSAPQAVSRAPPGQNWKAHNPLLPSVCQ